MARVGWWRSLVLGRSGLAGVSEVPAAVVAGLSDDEKLTAQLNTAVATAHTELARADLKAQALLAGTSAALIIGIAALDDEVPAAARVAGWGAAA